MESQRVAYPEYREASQLVPLTLTQQKKWSHDGTHRVISPSATYKRVRGFLSQIGVTRLADTSGLDPLNLPVYSAIRPMDSDPGIAVYNGKGDTKIQSKVGAVMEAIERYSGESWHGARVRGTYTELREAGYPVINPELMFLQNRHAYHQGTTELEWGPGWDLVTREGVWIPLNFLTCPYTGIHPDMWYSSTNGLASGNTIEEAICHALAELIERDGYTIAVVRTQLIPRMRDVIRQWQEGQPMVINRVVEPELYPNVRLETTPPRVHRLISHIQERGGQVWLKDITTDIGLPSFIGSIYTGTGNSTPLAAGGFGAHLNSEVAAIRALTEAVQGRNVQIQGAREDATKYHGVIQPNHGTVLWCADTERMIDFSDIPSTTNGDILDDIEDMLARLQAVGIQHIYVADLTDPALDVPVVRAIIPELECWFLTDFDPERTILGTRAQRYLP